MSLANYFSLMFRRVTFHDDVLDLYLSDDDVSDASCGIQDGFLFYIYLRRTKKYVGYISLRMGESPALYYLGHIGYRIEQAYRGHGYAYRACQIIKPLIQELKYKSLVITTDVDNVASRKTCEKLGCVLERIAPVPREQRIVCSGSREKVRYIWLI